MTARECWEQIQSLTPGVLVSVSHTVRGAHESVHVFRHDTEASIFIYLINTTDARDGRDVLGEAVDRVSRGEWKAKPEPEPAAVGL